MHTTISGALQRIVRKRGNIQREWPDCFEMTETTVTQPSTKQMSYSSRGPRLVRLPLQAEDRKSWLQCAQAHQNWTIEDWKKNISWSDESRFLRDVPHNRGSPGTCSRSRSSSTERYRLQLRASRGHCGARQTEAKHQVEMRR